MNISNEGFNPNVMGMILSFGVLHKKVYEGTVPFKVIARRRAANKAARIARRQNRG